MAAETTTIKGHPTLVLENAHRPPTLITVCAECGSMRSVLFLSFGPRRDRWFCTKCRTEGDARPAMFPIS